MKLRFAASVAALLAVAALASCSGGGSATGGGTGQTTSLQQQARAVWLEYSRCVRTHGYPNFPDPVVNAAGKPSWSHPTPQLKTIGQQVQGSCGWILDRLPAAAQGRTPVTAAELHQEVLFAQCLRRHGLPDWPDPLPDGTFRLLNTPYASMGKTGPVLAGLQACHRYDTFGGVRGSS